MATAGERLRSLAGASGSAASLLLLLGSGITAADVLKDYSGLPAGSAAEHILAETQVVVPPVIQPPVLSGGRGGYASVSFAKKHDYKPKVILPPDSIISEFPYEEDDEELLSLLVQFVGNSLCQM